MPVLLVFVSYKYVVNSYIVQFKHSASTTGTDLKSQASFAFIPVALASTEAKCWNLKIKNSGQCKRLEIRDQR